MTLRNILETEIAYLAGFFDGEGFIIICKDKTRLGNPSYRLRIGASQVIKSPIDLLKDKFGGLVRLQEKPNAKHRSIYTWEQHSQKAVDTLKILLPYLLTKKDQANFAIDWASINNTFQHKRKTEEDINWLEEQKLLLKTMKGYL